MNNQPHNSFAAPSALGIASHPRSVTHQVTFHSAAAVAQQQQEQQLLHHHLQHPTYLTHPAATQGVPPFVLATHVSVPLTVQPPPQSLHVAPSGSHPSIYKPQLSDLKRLCQLMLDASAASPINLTPFDALFLDADGLMELASCMQLKVVELATDISLSEGTSSRQAPTSSSTAVARLDNAATTPEGSRPSPETQRLRAELHASRTELQQALSVIGNLKERERQFELLQQQHARTASQLTDALATVEELKHNEDVLKRRNGALLASHDTQVKSHVEELRSMSQKNDKFARQLQVAVRKFKAEMDDEKKQRSTQIDSLRRTHERALLCQMRASVRSLRAIKERNQHRDVAAHPATRESSTPRGDATKAPPPTSKLEQAEEIAAVNTALPTEDKKG